MLCTNIVLNVKTKNNFCTQHVVNLYFSWKSMNNLSSYSGLADSRIRASDLDLPVSTIVYCLVVNISMYHYEFIYFQTVSLWRIHNEFLHI